MEIGVLDMLDIIFICAGMAIVWLLLVNTV